MNWTIYFQDTKELKEAGFSLPILGNDKESAKKRQKVAKFILNNMKGKENEK